VDRFALQLFDRKEGRLITRLSRFVEAERFEAVKPRPGEGIAGWVFEWQTPQAVSDVAADPRNRSAPIDSAGVASTLCVPMQVGDDVIGVIQAMSSKRRLFTVSEMELLYTVANQAAVAVENAERFQQTRARSHEVRRYMRRLANAIGAALEDSDATHVLCDLAVALMRADRGAVYRVDGDQLRLLASSGFRASGPDESLPIGQGLAGWVARRGQSFAVAQLREEPRALPHGWLARERLTSYLGIPINLARKTVGVVEVYSQESHEFTREEAHILSTFTRRARFADKLAGRDAAG
jgi:GAF domain-containing protein